MAFWSKIQNELWDNYLGEIPENTGNIQEKKKEKLQERFSELLRGKFLKRSWKKSGRNSLDISKIYPKYHKIFKEF